MSRNLFSCSGGHIALPDSSLVLIGRQDGGNLIVVPQREVWDRSELTAEELMRWSFLVAATGQAMLDSLPQLAGGCVNYWDAGNWALNDEAEPRGPKTAREYRKVHLHLLGRSPTAADPSWKWGEAPSFPKFAERYSWAAKNERLDDRECRAIVNSVVELLKRDYGFLDSELMPWSACTTCGYPCPRETPRSPVFCEECQP